MLDIEKVESATLADTEDELVWTSSIVLELITRLRAAESKQILSASARQFKQMEERLEAAAQKIAELQEEVKELTYTLEMDRKFTIQQLEIKGSEMNRHLKEKIEAKITLVKQAAVIEKLREALTNANRLMPCAMYAEALALPTDSKQILAKWLDKELGDPFAYVSKRDPSFVITATRQWADSGFELAPLFKKPEIK